MKIMPRIKRQIIYGFFYLLIFAAVGFGIFSYTKNIAFVSCSDNEQNGDEAGIDCGGSECIACEIKYAELPEIEWVKLFLTNPASEFESDNSYSVVFKLNNPNEKVGTPEIVYFYNVFSGPNSREVVFSAQGQTFISPSESKLVLFNFLSPKEINKVQISLGRDIGWLILENPIYDNLRFINIDSEYLSEDEQGFFRVEGVLLNQTRVYLPKVEIIALPLDSNGNILSVNQTFLDNVGVGREDDFQIVWFNEFNGQVAEVRLEAVVNEFSLIR